MSLLLTPPRAFPYYDGVTQRERYLASLPLGGAVQLRERFMAACLLSSLLSSLMTYAGTKRGAQALVEKHQVLASLAQCPLLRVFVRESEWDVTGRAGVGIMYSQDKWGGAYERVEGKAHPRWSMGKERGKSRRKSKGKGKGGKDDIIDTEMDLLDQYQVLPLAKDGMFDITGPLYEDAWQLRSPTHLAWCQTLLLVAQLVKVNCHGLRPADHPAPPSGCTGDPPVNERLRRATVEASVEFLQAAGGRVRRVLVEGVKRGEMALVEEAACVVKVISGLPPYQAMMSSRHKLALLDLSRCLVDCGRYISQSCLDIHQASSEHLDVVKPISIQERLAGRIWGEEEGSTALVPSIFHQRLLHLALNMFVDILGYGLQLDIDPSLTDSFTEGSATYASTAAAAPSPQPPYGPMMMEVDYSGRPMTYGGGGGSGQQDEAGRGAGYRVLVELLYVAMEGTTQMLHLPNETHRLLPPPLEIVRADSSHSSGSLHDAPNASQGYIPLSLSLCLLDAVDERLKEEAARSHGRDGALSRASSKDSVTSPGSTPVPERRGAPTMQPQSPRSGITALTFTTTPPRRRQRGGYAGSLGQKEYRRMTRVETIDATLDGCMPESVSVESFTSMFGMAVERSACLCWTYCQRLRASNNLSYDLNDPLLRRVMDFINSLRTATDALGGQGPASPLKAPSVSGGGVHRFGITDSSKQLFESVAHALTQL
mmetsp:Transcript_10403/g.30044  ORF Transcript_10403/g.30044 Transcript_10403/m.30044 type:complete len:711 (+) Transcript_10403:1-2133(+)